MMNFQADSLLKLVRTGGPSRKRRVTRRILNTLRLSREIAKAATFDLDNALKQIKERDLLIEQLQEEISELRKPVKRVEAYV